MRILLVEDEKDAAEMLAKGLREQSYAVDVASDGESALEAAWITPYDAIILDWMLPAKSGYDVCRELRATGFAAPILMLTAKDTVEDRVAGLDGGADDYLVKPFHFRELLARLRALMRRGPELTPDVLEVGDLEVDTRSRQVRRAGKTIDLTSKEYAFLEFLARNAGKVVGRAEISEHVWADDYDPFSHLIEVYVMRLRKKLGDTGPNPLIRTRRGEGYILSEPSGLSPNK
jgi:two-component system copper resistance phosphate regulon response regulator CusR